jgi:hypothetical protein
VFLQGPESSPTLRTSLAQSRPVLPYQIERPAASSAYASARGQQHNRSSISIAGMASKEVCAHSVPAPRQGSQLSDERARALGEAAAAAKQATAGCSAARHKLLRAQFSLGNGE